MRRVPWLAAGLGALAARDAHGQSLIDTRLLYYKESGGRMQVLDPVMLIQQDLGDAYGQLGLVLSYDAISGASPTGSYPRSDVTTSASGHLIQSGTFPTAQYRDARKAIAFSYGRRFGAHLPTIDISYSKEKDYIARAAGFSDAWTLLHGLGTLHFGVSLSRDLVEPVTNHLHLPKSENGYSLGWTQVLGERDLLDVSASLMQLSGYLDDPYTVVPIGPVGSTVDFPEHRPGSRSRRALVVKYGHSYLWDSALKATYRFYDDDWGIRAHTLELQYDQHVESDWIISPRIRLYTQSRASFYAARLDQPQTDMSADYRLSAMQSILGGLTITRRINDSLSVNLGATLQSQRGTDRINVVSTTSEGPVGTLSLSAADLNVTTITAGFTWRY